MKRLLIIFAFILSVAVSYAKAPRLAVEELFDGRYNKEKSVYTSIYKRNGSYYRSMTVKDNSGIVSAFIKALDKDIPKSSANFCHTGADGKYTLVKITNNGETIDVGLQEDPSGNSAYLFIKGPEEAFK